MPMISDNFQKENLKRYSINIKTKYIVGDKILERNSDNSYNDDIKNGIVLEKEYYINKKLIKTENNFDTRIEYTYVSKDQEDREYTCPNCGFHSNLHNFIDGCQYCGTYYNLDYNEKKLGTKSSYDRVLRSTKYRLVTAIIDIISSIILSFIFIKTTSRTFNSYDISKVFIYGAILSLILYYLFYITDAYILLGPIKKYKDRQNQKQIEFWKKTKLDKNRFFNNLNYEIRKKYYKNNEIIDYDIIDYDEFNDSINDGILNVEIKIYVRIVKYKKDKLTSEYVVDSFRMKRTNSKIYEFKDGPNIIKCHNCGASIDASKGFCNYCNTKIEPLQEWVLE